jgi:hypothetical protein
MWVGGIIQLPALHGSDVSQQRANRVTGVIVQMIKCRYAQAFDGGARTGLVALRKPQAGCWSASASRRARSALDW